MQNYLIGYCFNDKLKNGLPTVIYARSKEKAKEIISYYNDTKIYNYKYIVFSKKTKLNIGKKSAYEIEQDQVENILKKLKTDLLHEKEKINKV